MAAFRLRVAIEWACNLRFPTTSIPTSNKLCRLIAISTPFLIGYQARNFGVTTVKFNDEVEKAKGASYKTGEKSLFTKIMEKSIPAKIIHEDDQCIAIADINPQAPVHLLVIPRKVIPTLSSAEDSDAQLLGHLLLVARKLAKERNLEGGFRLVINNGRDAAQSVYHLHVHVLGGRQLKWPPG